MDQRYQKIKSRKIPGAKYVPHPILSDETDLIPSCGLGFAPSKAPVDDYDKDERIFGKN